MKSDSSAPRRKHQNRPRAVAVRRQQTSVISTIESLDDIKAGVAALRLICPVMAQLHDLTGDPPLRRNEAGFAGLARIIVGQQVSVASATAIWAKCQTTIKPLSADRILAMTDTDFNGAGLSRPKIKTLRAVAAAVRDGLDLDALAQESVERARADLTAVSGIGPWTADVYLMFCLGVADTFAAGDLALQIAAQQALQLDERPDAKAMAVIAERWQPWRGVAARVLWAYYAHLKAQKSALPV